LETGIYTRRSGRVTRIRFALLCMDLAVVAGVDLLIGSTVDAGRVQWPASLASLAISLIFLPVILFLNGAYSLSAVQRAIRMFRAVCQSFAAYFVVEMSAHFFIPQLGKSPLGVTLGVVGVGVGVCVNRALLLKALHDARDRYTVLIVGAGWSGRTIGETLQETLGNQVRIVGYVDDDPAKQGKEVVPGCWVIGRTDDLVQLVIEYQVVEIVLAVSEQVRARLFSILQTCAEHGANAVGMVPLYEELTGRVPVKHIDDAWFLYCFAPERQWLYESVKRATDVVVSLVGLAVLAVLYPVVAAAILLDTGRPVLYRQTRVGRGERLFTILKFRTMVQNAEANGAVWAQENDPRTTRVGQLLRKTRLDEFPQLWNVLKGEMSLLGPRPERPEFVRELSERIPFYNRRHAVLPGITGWAQVRYPYGSSVEDALQKLQYDLYYIKHRSFFLDAVICLKTLVTMVCRQGR
ncbi:MAG: sugar transferase, partial [Armatimonadota bacterium]|nr:sugar transferase [Armatimonadota bacterium]